MDKFREYFIGMRLLLKTVRLILCAFGISCRLGRGLIQVAVNQTTNCNNRCQIVGLTDSVLSDIGGEFHLIITGL